MDYELIKTAVLLVNLGGTVFVGVIAWNNKRFEQRQQAMEESFINLERKFNEKSTQLAVLREEMAKAPARDEIVRIHERIDGKFADIDSRLARIGERIEQNARENNLLLGQLLGQVTQMNEEKQR